MDITIMSDKSQSEYNLYRIDKSGKIDVAENSNFTDVIGKTNLEADVGMDYADDDVFTMLNADIQRKKGEIPPVMIDKKGFAIIVEDVKKKDKKCCRPKRTKCTEGQDRKKCVHEKGTTVCGGKCKKLKLFIKKKSQQQKEPEMQE